MDSSEESYKILKEANDRFKHPLLVKQREDRKNELIHKALLHKSPFNSKE